MSRLRIAALAALALAPLAANEAVALERRTLAYVCNRINDGRRTSECFRASRGLFIDEWAAGACDRIQSTEGTISCIGAIAGRSYTEEEAGACDRISGGNETTRCLAYAGRPTWGPGPGPWPGTDPQAYLREILHSCRRHNRYDREILRCIELSAGITDGPTERF